MVKVKDEAAPTKTMPARSSRGARDPTNNWEAYDQALYWEQQKHLADSRQKVQMKRLGVTGEETDDKEEDTKPAGRRQSQTNTNTTLSTKKRTTTHSSPSKPRGRPKKVKREQVSNEDQSDSEQTKDEEAEQEPAEEDGTASESEDIKPKPAKQTNGTNIRQEEGEEQKEEPSLLTKAKLFAQSKLHLDQENDDEAFDIDDATTIVTAIFNKLHAFEEVTTFMNVAALLAKKRIHEISKKSGAGPHRSSDTQTDSNAATKETSAIVKSVQNTADESNKVK